MVKKDIVRQAGAIPYFEVDGKLMTIMVTARSRSSFWLFPKGHIDAGLTPEEAAELESYEEAGLRGAIRKKAVGTYYFSKLGRDYRVKLFPLKVKKVLKKWPEAASRTRHMVTFDEAIVHLEDPAMQELAIRLYRRLTRKNTKKLTQS